ncbi:PucR family transcriptional regulator [Gorillibacterium timonense]|uniref:PucR family transcriptional regulator n=1 Tax=Gorillibacterium timonense TaxID=1689269 RepID=UPI00071D95EB|nr:helix-turn-helix domain-containing protein [Gorillibacterium timonense]
MDWEKLAEQLEQRLGAAVSLRNEPHDHSRKGGDKAGSADGDGQSGERLFPLEDTADGLLLLAVAGNLSEREQALIELAVEAGKMGSQPKAPNPNAQEERRAILVRDWFLQHLESGQTSAELPEPLASQIGFHKPRIPLLLTGEFSAARKQLPYREFKKLLESFFDTEIHLIPLMDKEWLILAPETLLADSYGEEEGEDRVEDSLSALAEGMYEMLSSEWLGECHLSIDYPMTPAKSLLPVALQLRETILLGKAFHPGINIHLPWKLQMEKLLYEIPEEEKLLFVSRVFKRSDPSLEGELLTTLESFFALECNVSETAKKLYIHRNTLLYRLDKFKQETGLDVRTFNDAVLVRIAVLLYKVTKRQ